MNVTTKTRHTIEMYSMYSMYSTYTHIYVVSHVFTCDVVLLEESVVAVVQKFVELFQPCQHLRVGPLLNGERETFRGNLGCFTSELL